MAKKAKKSEILNHMKHPDDRQLGIHPDRQAILNRGLSMSELEAFESTQEENKEEEESEE